MTEFRPRAASVAARFGRGSDSDRSPHEISVGFACSNPIYWLTNRIRLKNWLVWMFLAVVLLLWILGLALDSADWTTPGAYIFTGFILHLVLKFWLAGEACRRFCLDRQSDALELLLSTPLGVREILRGQLMSLARQFGPPVAEIG